MKKCAYCGRENSDDAVRCSECGTDEFKTEARDTLPELDEQEELVTLTTCQRLTDADMVLGKLASIGIEAFIPDEFLMQTIGFNLNTYGFVRVQVRRKDLEAAKTLVAGSVDTPLTP